MLYVALNFADINTNAIMFTLPSSYLRRSYLINDTSEEKAVLTSIFSERILVNLRTYDTQALIFYANDHLNNFAHMYIHDGMQVVFLFNYENKIYNITANYANLNSSKSVQIAIERAVNETTMYVNDKNKTIPVGVKLLDEYSNKPWVNPEMGKLVLRVLRLMQ